MPTLTIGTRQSTLALWQTHYVADALRAAWPDLEIEIVPFVTRGDKTLDQPLPEIGGKGLFTQELEQAQRLGRVDVAVHSLKDLPVDNADELTLGAVLGRADVRDVLITNEDHRLGSLPLGAVVGTSSLRRQAQLRAARPDIEVQSIRGNVETRIRKVRDGLYDATVLAAAGVNRLDLQAEIAQVLPLEVMLPAPGQGALAVQCRTDDEETLRRLSAIDNQWVRAMTSAERSFLHHLSGGCATPVAAYATWMEDQLYLRGLVGAPDGSRLIEVEASGREAWALGEMLAERALARGAKELLNHG